MAATAAFCAVSHTIFRYAVGGITSGTNCIHDDLGYWESTTYRIRVAEMYL
ncbi:hypothetical protein D3C85_1883130 [compost metagenome]